MTRLCKDPFISVKEITSYMKTLCIHFGRCVGFPILFILLIFLFQDNFYIVIETYHIGDRGEQENVHELDAKKLKERSVVNIDIANDHVDANDYKKDEDPTIFKSEKTGRGPLSGDWKVGTIYNMRAMFSMTFHNE